MFSEKQAIGLDIFTMFSEKENLINGVFYNI